MCSRASNKKYISYCFPLYYVASRCWFHPTSEKVAIRADLEVLLMRMQTIQVLKMRTRTECMESFETDGAQVSTTSRRRDWGKMNGVVAVRGQHISLGGGLGSKTEVFVKSFKSEVEVFVSSIRYHAYSQNSQSSKTNAALIKWRSTPTSPDVLVCKQFTLLGLSCVFGSHGSFKVDITK